MKAIPESYDDIQKLKYELWTEDFNLELFAEKKLAQKIVAEGDSWFDYAPGLDILDNLKRDYGYKIYKKANAGDTIENMAYGTEIKNNFNRKIPQIKETLDAISLHKPRVFLLSGIGNDIAGPELNSFLNHKDSGLPIIREDYVDYMFFEVFKGAYDYIIKNVWKIDPTIQVISHGYAHAIPDGRAVINFPFNFKFIGPWLRPTLAKKNITNPIEAANVIRVLIDKGYEMMDKLTENENFHYIDLRDEIRREDWVNELHLSSEAYQRVAKLFHDKIQAVK